MMIHENDQLIIPDKYRKMPVSELRQEKERIYKTLNVPKTTNARKKVLGNTIQFNL